MTRRNVRRCIICYAPVGRRMLFCRKHYLQFKAEITEALSSEDRSARNWITELDKMTKRETRRLEKERNQLPILDFD